MIKKLSSYLILVTLWSNIHVTAQTIVRNDHFDIEVRSTEGDLNKDRIKDKVVLTMDTINETVPLRLQIFLSEPNGQWKIAVSSTQIVDPEYPAYHNGKLRGFQIPIFEIENGILALITELKGGMGKFDFMYRNGNFDLIHVSKNTWDGKNLTTMMEHDLQTGIRTEIDQNLGSEKVIDKRVKTMIIKTLPKIQDFKYSDIASF